VRKAHVVDQYLSDNFPTLERGVSQNANDKLTLSAEDLQKLRHLLISGLYRHFDAQGRLLYVGETRNFLNRTAYHLRHAKWREEICRIELQPMTKANAMFLEPKVIAVERPLYNNTFYYPENPVAMQAARKAISEASKSTIETVMEIDPASSEMAEKRAYPHQQKAVLETRNARLKLPVRKKPHWLPIGQGISVGYRRNQGPGSWSFRVANGGHGTGHWIQVIGVADDYDTANGDTVFDFWQAQNKARALGLAGRQRKGRWVWVKS
jgi:hypothetical protein